ncbi:PREDICTED: taste receptor type 2 member 9-like [Nanorana parkeri]|uniref:taste receptor type 2 member 9-like n=1 Tax=Nanorana parkeri TaxID=125878 RepID=UPI000854FFC7|nr:PREDICTED: taste receptor type 2 member 9-like [Nanorana parkeri]
MVALLWVVGFIVAIAECVLGVLFNFYIIVLNAAHWRRGLPRSLCDKILVLMAINNICLQCDMNICTFLFIMYPNMLQYPNISSTVSVFLIFQFYFSFWITAILCVYYCLRIVSFKLRFFIHLKTNITNVVTRFLIGAGLGSFAISLLSIWEIHLKMCVIARNVTSSPMIIDTNIELSAITLNLSSGSWIIDATIELTQTYKFLTIGLGCCLPFVLAILSIVLTLTSLWTHYHNMKYNRSGFSIPSLDAHKRAARIMVYLSILYAIFYLSEVSLLASSLTIQSMSEMAALFFVLIYPTVQSSIVILGNSKLCPTYLKNLRLGKKV